MTRSLTITLSDAPEETDAAACQLALHVPGRDERAVEIRLDLEEDVHPDAKPIERRTRHGRSRQRRSEEARKPVDDPGLAGGGEWPVTVRTAALAFDAALARSLDDLLTLRGELDGLAYYAAGVPWFSTLFGRDSLIAAYQTLAFDPAVAADTLRLLAGRQGTKVDDWRDEQPGKILHELRIGELARLHEIPHTPYYGTIDATPLFLVVLARHARWTGSLDVFRELRGNADRALAWIDDYGARVGDGYVAYDSTTEHGLVNQGWKDSGDAIVTADGSIAEPPIALAEVQGYVYAAKREIADLYERDGEVDRADRLRAEAEALRDRFERDFWSDELGCYVLALAADGAPCAVVTSNAGQVLWSGIASAERARAVARRLLADDMFAGWGVRTLSHDASAYNPVGYHLGTIWPHDNGLIAEGFRRYGLDDEAEKLLDGLVEAASDFPQQRLPECFAGYARETFGVPVRYPIACHPQAWAAGSIPHVLAVTLGLVPDGFGSSLGVIRPRLPRFVEHLEVRGVAVADGRATLRFDQVDGRTSARLIDASGTLDVRIEDDRSP